MSLNQKFLDTQEEKNRLQQNLAIIKMEEKIILKEVIKLEHLVKTEFILILLILGSATALLVWKFLYN